MPVTKNTKKTFCSICEASCGLIATVEDDKVVQLLPDPDHPVSRGFACSKGIRFVDVISDPDRVVSPMRRMPDGTFEPATWDEAIADIGPRLRAIQAEHGNASIGLASGNPTAWNFSGGIGLKALSAALGTHHRFSAASLDINNYWVAADIMYGNPSVNLLPDFADTHFALILGANPVVSHGSMVTTGRIREVLLDIPARGGRVVVVDPRRSETAELFEHRAIRPGGDPWMLGAMLRVIVDEDLVDHAAIEAQAAGMEGLRDIAAQFDIDRAAAETGMTASAIAGLARDLAAAPSAVVYGRCGASLNRFSTLTKFLLDTLALVTGNVDRRGGMVLSDPMVDLDGDAARHGRLGRARWTTRVSGFPEVNGTAPIACLPEEITTPGEGKMHALITMSSNLVNSAPGSESSADALRQLDLMIALDPYITETSRLADWILPPTLWLEREQLPIFTQAESTMPNAQWVAPVVPPRGEARDDFWILNMIAKELGLVLNTFPGSARLARLGIRPHPRHLVNLMMRRGPHGDHFGLRRGGLSRRKLMRTGAAVKLADNCAVGVLGSRVMTEDGRVRLSHPEIRDEVARMVGAPTQSSSHPLLMFSVRELRSHNSWLHNVPTLMTGDRRRCRLLMHAADAVRSGVHDRDRVTVTSPWGEIVVPVEITADVSEGSVGLTQGWGHQGTWQTAVASGGENYNTLTPGSAEEIDRLSGNAFLNGVPVAVGPVRAVTAAR